MFDLLQNLDYYCERVGPGLLNEPLNLFSNAAFFCAALYIQKLAKKRRVYLLRVRILVGVCYSIGVGSALFHSFANVLTVLADIIPIALFVVTAVWFVMEDVFHFSMTKRLLLAGGFVVAAVLCSVFLKNPIFNGSEMYFTPLLMLIVMTAFSYQQKNANSREVLLATLIFASSLLVRMVDLAFCPFWPFGTHFLWHILNGATLLFVMRFYLESDGY